MAEEININETAEKINKSIASGALADPRDPSRRKRSLHKEPCDKCGKPTRYGQGNRRTKMLCAACLKVEGPKPKPSPTPCSEPASSKPHSSPACDCQSCRVWLGQQAQEWVTAGNHVPCPSCGKPMAKTETGFRCEPCTARIVMSADDPECNGCDYNEAGVCKQADDSKCPITAKPTDEPHGPYSAAEETRNRARAELAARSMVENCAECGANSWNWITGDRGKRIAVVLKCSECNEQRIHLLTREGLYLVAVAHRMLALRLEGLRAFFDLGRLDALAVLAEVDHDVLIIRAGGETQRFLVEDADPAIEAVTKLWGMP